MCQMATATFTRQCNDERKSGCFVRVSRQISLSINTVQMDRCWLRNAGTGKSVPSCKIMRFKSVSFLFICVKTSKSLRSFECGMFCECLVRLFRDYTQVSGTVSGSQHGDLTRIFERRRMLGYKTLPLKLTRIIPCWPANLSNCLHPWIAATTNLHSSCHSSSHHHSLSLLSSKKVNFFPALQA